MNAPGGLPQIIVTIAVAAGLFLAVWALLTNIIFKKLFETLEDRESRTVGSDKQAGDLHREKAVLAEQLEEKVKTARLEGVALRDERLGKARERANAILNEAVSRAQADLSRASDELERIKSEAHDQLFQDVDTLSDLMVQKVSSSAGHTVH